MHQHDSEKGGGGGGENSPISPPVDQRLTLRQWKLKTEENASNAFRPHYTPDEFENGGFTLKTNQMSSVHTMPGADLGGGCRGWCHHPMR